MRKRASVVVGLGVIGAALLLSNIGGETGKQSGLTVEEWQRRVAERIDYLLAENVALRQQCAQLDQDIKGLWFSHNLSVKAQMNIAQVLADSLKQINAWGANVEVALRQARTPIFIQPPEIVINDPSSSRIANELHDLNWQIRLNR